MKKFDKFLLGLLLGSASPLLLIMVCFIFWFFFFQSWNVFIFILTGLVAGIFIDLLFFNRTMAKILELPVWILIGLYLFYNIGLYGMFMGFPVFNLSMGIIAGYYYGLKIKYLNLPSDQSKQLTKKVSLFTTIVMLLICISTAVLALREKTIGLEVQGMLNLNFEVTKGMIILIILLGGLSLISLQYFVTKQMIKITVNRPAY
jgi:hypothetical protein